VALGNAKGIVGMIEGTIKSMNATQLATLDLKKYVNKKMIYVRKII
jgi:hypothetical protein